MKKTIIFLGLSLLLHGLLYTAFAGEKMPDAYMTFRISATDMKLTPKEQTFYFTHELPDGTEVWCTKSAFVHEEGKDWQRTFCAFYTPMSRS